MRRSQPYLPWWQALHRCLHRWSCQKILPASLTSVAHCPCQMCQKHQWWLAPSPSHSLRVRPAGLLEEVLCLQGQMNAALEWLLTARVTMDSHCRELVLNAFPCAWMRPSPSRPLRRLRWATQPPSRRPKCATQSQSWRLRWATHLPSRRQKCTMQPGSKRPRCIRQPMPVSCNRHTGNVC